MKNTYFLLLLILVLVLSCQPKGLEESPPSLESFVYKMDLKAKSVDFLSQVESISVFGFEETEHSLLNPSSLFFNYEDGVLVVNEGSGTVYVFDVEGSYVKKFNRKGNGPEEYRSMHNTVYRDGLIEIYDVTGQKIMQYSLDGGFLSALRLPYKATHAIFNDGHYLLSIGHVLKGDTTSYKIALMDLEGKEYARALPFDTPPPFPALTDANDFRMAGNKLLFSTALLTDSIWQVDGTDVKPFIRFDFGEDWFWTEEMYADGNAMSAVSGANKVWIYTWVLGPERIEMTYNTDFIEPRRGYVDRSTGQFYHYKFNAWGGKNPDIRNVRFEGNELLMIMTPDLLEVFMTELGGEKCEITVDISLKDLLASENPLMVNVRFK